MRLVALTRVESEAYSEFLGLQVLYGLNFIIRRDSFFQTAFAIPSSLSLLGLWLALEAAILLSPRFANNTPSSVLPCQTACGFVRCLKQAQAEPMS